MWNWNKVHFVRGCRLGVLDHWFQPKWVQCIRREKGISDKLYLFEALRAFPQFYVVWTCQKVREAQTQGFELTSADRYRKGWQFCVRVVHRLTFSLTLSLLQPQQPQSPGSACTPRVDPPMTTACVLWKKSTWRYSGWAFFERGRWGTLLVNIRQTMSLESSPHKSLQMKWDSYWNWSHEILLCEALLRYACGMGVFVSCSLVCTGTAVDGRCDLYIFLVSAEM